MAIKRRSDGRWRARYRDASGREHAHHARTKGEAQRWLDQERGKLARGTWTDPARGRMTFGIWCAEYLGSTHKRPTTAARDAVVARCHLLPALEARPLAAITPVEVRAVVDRMAERLAPATVRTNYGVLRAILGAAVAADLIARSPCRGVRLPAQERAPIRFLSSSELERLAEATPLEYRLAIYLAGVLGLRWSEVAGLRVGSVDFLRRTLTVTETVAEVSGKLIAAPVKTPASRRTLSIPPFLVDTLAEHLRRTGRTDPADYVLQAPDGGPMRAGNFRARVWRPAVKAAGLEGLTFHGLRHTAAGLMIEVGAHIEAIKQRMGHSSIRVTSDVYGSLLPSVDATVTRDLERLFSSSRGPIADSGGGEAGQV